jgi:hypothetical protein
MLINSCAFHFFWSLSNTTNRGSSDIQQNVVSLYLYVFQSISLMII